MNPMHEPIRYWSKSPTEMLAIMGSRREGLSSEEVKERFKLNGRNILTKEKHHQSLALFTVNTTNLSIDEAAQVVLVQLQNAGVIKFN